MRCPQGIVKVRRAIISSLLRDKIVTPSEAKIITLSIVKLITKGGFGSLCDRERIECDEIRQSRMKSKRYRSRVLIEPCTPRRVTDEP